MKGLRQGAAACPATAPVPVSTNSRVIWHPSGPGALGAPGSGPGTAVSECRPFRMAVNVAPAGSRGRGKGGGVGRSEAM